MLGIYGDSGLYCVFVWEVEGNCCNIASFIEKQNGGFNKVIKLSSSGDFVEKTWAKKFPRRFPVDDVRGVFLEEILSIHMSGEQMHH